MYNALTYQNSYNCLQATPAEAIIQSEVFIFHINS